MTRRCPLLAVLMLALCAGCGGGGAGDDCDVGEDCGDAFYCLYASPDDDVGECVAAPGGCSTPVGCGCTKALEVCSEGSQCTGDDEAPATVKCQ